MSRRYFVIFATMRTGSNLLEQELGRYEGVRTFGEAFNPSFLGNPNTETLAGWTLAERDRDPLGFLAALRGAAPGIVGFRHFDGHSPALRAHALADPECVRILLRRDPAASYISLKIAQATGQWLVKDSRFRRRAQVRFDPEEFDRYEADLNRYYAGLEDTMALVGTGAEEIRYPELTDREAIARIASAIGLTGDPSGPAPKIVRQNPEALASKVVNSDEMLAHLGRPIEEAEAPPPPRRWVMSRHLPLAWAPGAGEAVSVGLSLMNYLDHLHAGVPRLKHRRLAKAPEAVFDLGLDPGGRFRVFLSEPPLHRFHGLFVAQGLQGKTALPHVVRALDGMHGEIGPFRIWAPALETEEGIARHIERFSTFLDLIGDARGGVGPHPLHEGWAEEEAPPADMVLRRDRFVDDASALADRLAVEGVETAHLYAIDQIDRGPLALVEQAVTAELAAKVAALG